MPGSVVNYAVTGVGNVAYNYDSFNRMNSVYVNSSIVGSYGYAASGDRTSKTAGGVRTRFVSAEDHTLLAEKADSSSLWTNYLWFNGELVGMTRGGVRYAIHNDHLGRPEMATSVGKAIVWKSNNGTFGGQSVVTNTIGGLNVGFPGQYFDAESGLWYNVSRYYDPHIGRYYQVDTIGLKGGTNPYVYVLGNPTNLIDSLGLESYGIWNKGGYIPSIDPTVLCQQEAALNSLLNITPVVGLAKALYEDPSLLDIYAATLSTMSGGAWAYIEFNQTKDFSRLRDLSDFGRNSKEQEWIQLSIKADQGALRILKSAGKAAGILGIGVEAINLKNAWEKCECKK